MTGKNAKSGIFKRFVRGAFSIVILSAFVLAISVLVKSLATASPDKLIDLARPILSRLNVDIDEDQVGEVAGEFVERLMQTNLSGQSSGSSTDNNSQASREENISASSTERKLVKKVAVLAEIHDDLDSLKKALDKAKKEGVSELVILGDLTNFGSVENLKKVKEVLDASGIKYYVIPGDHDLAQSVGAQNFTDVFGKTYYFIKSDAANVLVLDNSANFTKVSPEIIKSFSEDVTKADLVMLSQPLFAQGLVTPFDKMYMGSTKDIQTDPNLLELQAGVKKQGEELLSVIRKSEVRAVISGDHHHSSELTDPERKSLKHFVVGAITSKLDELPQKVLQSPRFSVLSLYDDKSYDLSEIVLD